MSTGISVWAAAAASQLADVTTEALHRYSSHNFNFEVKPLNDSLWISVALGENANMAFRTAYSPGGFTSIKVKPADDDGIEVKLKSTIGDHKIIVGFPKADEAVLRYTVTFKPANDLIIPFLPRDIIIYGQDGDLDTEGEIFISQTGTRSGLIYGALKKPEAASFLYLQNLTALGDYNVDTKTSAAEVVGGQWPEIGLSLPSSVDNALQKNKNYTLSDAFITLTNRVPAHQFDIAKGFLNSLARLYLLLPLPETKYQDYLNVLPQALHDLQNNKGCWSHRSGHPYLNAYLCDYNTAPEIMVQLAVLLPVKDYVQWSGESCTMEKEITEGLPAFYDEELGTVVRWLPAEEHMLDESEEQKKPNVMDSWYLHHPLLNLARLVQIGDAKAKELLLPSADYAIKVAHHFNYEWPVFYKMDTLEVLKSETKEGEGGEKDVAGLYAHVMLQIWELTGDKKYLAEAEKAAMSMTKYGFDVFYQANNTMFSAKAMIFLHKVTKKEVYRDLAYLFLANIFKNVALWECNYGYSKHLPTFFALFPLNDAPYTAVYEEQEAYSGVHEFFSYAEGIDLIPSVPLLLAEFVKHMINRAIYYYPTMLPKEMLSNEIKTGELDPNLWIALEDIHDGWEQSGSVGQEVYGAGLAFGLVPRQYIRVPNQNFLVFTDYPILNKLVRGNTISFKILGARELTCRLLIVKQGDGKLPSFKIRTENEDDQIQFDQHSGKKAYDFQVHGNQKINISWN